MVFKRAAWVHEPAISFGLKSFFARVLHSQFWKVESSLDEGCAHKKSYVGTQSQHHSQSSIMNPMWFKVVKQWDMKNEYKYWMRLTLNSLTLNVCCKRQMSVECRKKKELALGGKNQNGRFLHTHFSLIHSLAIIYRQCFIFFFL